MKLKYTHSRYIYRIVFKRVVKRIVLGKRKVTPALLNTEDPEFKQTSFVGEGVVLFHFDVAKPFPK